MNDEERDATILRERAEKLAARGSSTKPRRLLDRVLLVEVGKECYGLPVRSMREVVEATAVAPLPALPACIAGVAAVRGELLSVVDLAEVYGRGKTGRGAFFAIVVSKRGAVALRIERVVGFRDVHVDDVLESVSAREDEPGRATRVTRDFVSLVDVDSVLAGTQIVVGSADDPEGTAP